MGRLILYGAGVAGVILLSLIYAILVAGGEPTGDPGASAPPVATIAKIILRIAFPARKPLNLAPENRQILTKTHGRRSLWHQARHGTGG